MSHGLTVERKLLKVERVIGEDTVTDVVAAEIQLPFKIIKVFDVIANIVDLDEQVRANGVQIAGNIDKQLFVVDKGDMVRHIPEMIPFQVFVPVAGAQPGMNAQVNVRILSVDTDLVRPQVVNQTITLEIFVKVTKTEQIEVVVDVQGKDITVEKELLKVDAVVGEDTVRQTITPTVTLPITAKKIFRILPSVRNVTAEIKQDLVIVRGIIHKQVFLVDEGELVRHASEDIPFTKSVPVNGARPGQQVQTRVRVFLEDYQIVDPPSRQLRQTLVIEAFVKVTEVKQIEVVVDVKGKFIRVFKELLKVESVVVDVLQQETVRATVALPIQAQKIFEILGEVVNLQGKAGFNQVTIQGVLHKQIFLVDLSNLVRHVREDVPFSFTKNAPGADPGMNVQVSADIVGDIMERLINERRLEQTAVLEIFAKVTRTVQLEVVVDVRREFPRQP